MSNDKNNKNSGRVTTREFYDALIAQNEEASNRELRINSKIENLTVAVTNVANQPAICQAYFEHLNKRDDANKDAIEKIDSKVNNLRIWEGFNTVLATVLGYFGIKLGG